MTPEQIGIREKLIAAWRAFAQGLMDLGYEPSEYWRRWRPLPAMVSIQTRHRLNRPFKKRGACTCGSHPRRGISI
jgi:hypothetical protein